MKTYTKEEIDKMEAKETTSKEGPNVLLYYKGTQALAITSGETWYKRIWYVLTNPFTYIFAGKLRY